MNTRGDAMKIQLDKKLVRRYSYLLICAVLLILIYKFIDNIGLITAGVWSVLGYIINLILPILKTLSRRLLVLTNAFFLDIFWSGQHEFQHDQFEN